MHKPGKNADRSSKHLVFILFFLCFNFIDLRLFAPESIYANAQEPTQQVSDKTNDTENLKTLDSLEEKIFHDKYIKDPLTDRVSRIENFLFGSKNEKADLQSRIDKIKKSMHEEKAEPVIPTPTPEVVPVIKPEELNKNTSEIPNQTSDDELSNTGVLGAVNQLEKKIFGKVFNELPFQKRVELLEESLFTKSEIAKMRKKTLLERISMLVKRGGLTVTNEPINLPPERAVEQSPKKSNVPQTYTIDPNTGHLIQEQTGQIVRDGDGNPITVKIPPLPPQEPRYASPPGFPPPAQNPFPQYGQQGQLQGYPQGLPGGAFPYDLLFPGGGLSPGGDQNY